jgi:hypothetical protein
MRWLALPLALLAAQVARADPQKGVRPRHTVEVLDDRAQIDDVIARLKQQPAPERSPASADSLKSERPPLPPEAAPNAKKAAHAADVKSGERWRRPHHDRGGVPDTTERPRRQRR